MAGLGEPATARRRPTGVRSVCSPVLVALALAIVACGDDRSAGDAPPGPTVPPGVPSGAWTKLADPPLSGRTHPVVADLDGRILVVGGWSFLCPPGADCVHPEVPRFADGAVYDPASGSWAPIAGAPFGFSSAPSAVSGGDLYVLAACDPVDECDRDALLRYRPSTDTWVTLPAPPDVDVGLALAASPGGGLIAFATSDETREAPHRLLRPGSTAWEDLPADPLAPVFDRFVFADGPLVYSFGSLIDREEPSKVGAAFDPAEGTWRELAPSGTQGYQVWPTDRGYFLNPHFGPNGGGVYDPVADAWAPFPDPPDDDDWRGDASGVVAADRAFYEYASGWIRDVERDAWVSIAARHDRDVYDSTVGSVGRTLVVAGGQEWHDDDGDLVGEVWVWEP